MKLRTILSTVLTAFLLARTASAASPHYEVTFSGAIVEQVTYTGTSGTVHTVPFNSGTIIKNVVTLSNGGIKNAKDVAIVYNPDNTSLDVINITNPASPVVLYANVVAPGNNSVLNGTVYNGKPTKLTGVSTLSDIEVTFPASSNTFVSNATSSYTYNTNTNVPLGFTIILSGNDNNRDLITGLIKKGTRVFNY